MGLDQYLTFVNDDKSIKLRGPMRHDPTTTVMCFIDEKIEFMPAEHNTWRNYWELHEFVKTIHPDLKSNELVPLTREQLENWFKSKDPAWDTPCNINYDSDEADNDEIPDSVYWRDFNRQVIRLATVFESKGFKMVYRGWY
jgi:hypothetical protein